MCFSVFECETEQKVDAGDHYLFIGRVKNVDIKNPDLKPLGFLRGRYTLPESQREMKLN